jgi:sec-independent protein translocase protein TatC
VIAILVFTIAAFINKEIVFDGILLGAMYPDFPTYRALCWLSHNLLHDNTLCLEAMHFNLISISMSGQFTTHMKVSLVTGLVLAFPYLLWEVWRFIRPALYNNERKYASGLVFWGSFLFFSGIAFGYYLLSPMSIYFLGNYQVSTLVSNQIHVGSFIDTVVMTTFGSGLLFELPIVVYFLAKVGIVTAAFLRKTRRISYVVILVVAAIITPPDATSQIIVSIPLFLLYEISIFIARKVERDGSRT